MFRLLAPSFALALLVAPALTARAQSGAHDMEARALFEAGRVAFIDERFEDALGHFRRAYELSRRPELLYNIAASLDRLDREAESLETFRDYLEALPDASNRDEVELRIRVLEAHVAAATPLPTTGTTTTTTTTTTVTTEAEAEEIAELETELGAETPIAVEGLSEDTSPEAPAGPAPPTPDGGHSVAEEPWLWVVVGLVVVGAAAGITAGVLLSQDPGYQPYSTGDATVMTLTGRF